MSALEGSTTVPVVGKVKTAYVAVAGAAVVGIVGYAWVRRSKSADDQAPDFYADTRTGSDLPTDDYKSPGGGGSSTPTDDGGFHAPRTDVEWAQAVVEKLTWYEPGFVSSTVGKYLAAQVLSADEQNVIREAWAQVGRPPGNQRIVTTQTTPTPPPPAKPATPVKPTTKPGSRPTGGRPIIIPSGTRPPRPIPR